MLTKIDVISGFLGSGKTTLIKKLLEEKLAQEKLVIIENEFGEISVDGSILRRGNFEVREINSGCICCSLTGDFENALLEVLKEFNPERIIIEPSGVGKLSDVLSLLNSKKLKERILINSVATVVDFLHYEIYADNFAEFFDDQIKHGKTILLSKTKGHMANEIEQVLIELKKLNNHANYITTPWDELHVDTILNVLEASNEIDLAYQMKEKKGYTLKRGPLAVSTEKKSHQADEVFKTLGFETAKTYEMQDIESLLQAVSKEEFGTIVRGKGILKNGKGKWYQFDYVTSAYEMIETTPDFIGRMCFIGTNLDKEKLARYLELTVSK